MCVCIYLTTSRSNNNKNAQLFLSVSALVSFRFIRSLLLWLDCVFFPSFSSEILSTISIGNAILWAKSDGRSDLHIQHPYTNNQVLKHLNCSLIYWHSRTIRYMYLTNTSNLKIVHSAPVACTENASKFELDECDNSLSIAQYKRYFSGRISKQ